MTPTIDVLRTILVERFRFEADSVVGDADLVEAGVDSLAAVELSMELEKLFGVKLTDEAILDAGSLFALAKLVDAQQ